MILKVILRYNNSIPTDIFSAITEKAYRKRLFFFLIVTDVLNRPGVTGVW